MVLAPDPTKNLQPLGTLRSSPEYTYCGARIPASSPLSCDNQAASRPTSAHLPGTSGYEGLTREPRSHLRFQITAAVWE